MAYIFTQQWRLNKVGKMFLTEEEIKIELPHKNETLKVARLKKIEFCSQTAYKHHEATFAYQGNNWLKIYTASEVIKQEFTISSNVHYKKFMAIFREWGKVVDARVIQVYELH